MKRTIFFLTILFYLLSSYSAYAQDNMVWFHYFNKFKLSYKFSIDSDIGYRNDFHDLARWQFRSGLKYDLTEDFNIRAGIMYVQGQSTNQELRFYQDLIYKARIGEVIIANRLRFEEQYFPTLNKTSYRLRFNPMMKFSTEIGLLSAGVEPFINLDGFKVSSNRMYFGITRYFTKNTLITLQYIRESSYSRTEVDTINSSHMIRIKIDHMLNPLRIVK
ncbi:DUF2490 domain-containing protein [Flammeovirga sp. OC4]|uniref:DUF2490 domain-containing protein n=1 Tax=Flammeovirga sp. OC4 TaxID=1382345 RepID=UPI0005C69E6B|nr:DUF2490 domain-containing protein [Flammeovirga sp. OC4]